jgi:hypothetical protein
MFIWRRLAGKSAFCGFKVGIFAVMANFALMGIIISQSREKSQQGEMGSNEQLAMSNEEREWGEITITYLRS